MITVDDFKVSREFQQLVPALTDEQFGQLKDNIIEDGEFTDKWHVWRDESGQLWLLDAHHRYRIYKTLSLKNLKGVTPPEIVEKKFPSKSHAKKWIIDHAMGTRHLTSAQQSVMRAMRLAIVQREITASGGSKSEAVEQTSEETGVSERQVYRDEQYLADLESLKPTCGEDIVKDVLDGKLKISKTQIREIAELPEDKQKETLLEASQKKPSPRKKKQLFDKKGVEVPEDLQLIFKTQVLFDAILNNAVPMIQDHCQDINEVLQPKRRISMAQAKKIAKDLYELFKAARPNFVCGVCKGAKCKACDGCGWRN